MQTTQESVSSNGQEQKVSNPFENTMLVSVTIGMLGVTKKVKTKKSDKSKGKSAPEDGAVPVLEVDTDADLESVKVSKKILDCEEYQAIVSLQGRLKAFLRRKTVPGGKRVFKNGTYPVTIKSITEVDETLEKFTQEFILLVKKFCEVYELRCEEHKARLKDLADDKDYPNVRKVRGRFRMGHQWISMGPPSSLADLNKDVYQREVKKIQENCRLAADDAILAVRVMLQELLKHAVEKLTPDKSGKRKKLYDTMLSNMREFLVDFRDWNSVTNDAELEVVVQKLEKVLEGKDMSVLRTDDFTRKMTAQALEKVKTQLDGMVENVKSRGINLDD